MGGCVNSKIREIPRKAVASGNGHPTVLLDYGFYHFLSPAQPRAT
jgi:hypothetical protein